MGIYFAYGFRCKKSRFYLLIIIFLRTFVTLSVHVYQPLGENSYIIYRAISWYSLNISKLQR